MPKDQTTCPSQTPTSETPKGFRSPNGDQLVFAYGNLRQGIQHLFSNAMLPGFERQHKGFASCRESADTEDFIMGRVVEVSDETLARLDTWAERSGDYHRFLANVLTLPNRRQLQGVWVYQFVEHATPATLKASINGGLRETAA